MGRPLLVLQWTVQNFWPAKSVFTPELIVDGLDPSDLDLDLDRLDLLLVLEVETELDLLPR